MADPSRDLFASNRIQLTGSSADELRPATVLERARSFLARSQASDGRWPGLVHSSVRTTAEYVLLLGVLNRVRMATGTLSNSLTESNSPADTSNDLESSIERMRCAAAHIAGQQLPSGLWNSGSRESDLDASVLAYLALRIAGHESQSEHVERARSAIVAAGGAYACEPISHYWFAALGEVPLSECWPLPVELGLLPDVVPGALSRNQLLSRVVLVSLAVLKACARPENVALAAKHQPQLIAELVSDQSATQGVPIQIQGDRPFHWLVARQERAAVAQFRNELSPELVARTSRCRTRYQWRRIGNDMGGACDIDKWRE